MHLRAEERCYEIPAAKRRAVRDPTGCGDAYRAGFLRDLDRETAGRVAGAIKIDRHAESPLRPLRARRPLRGGLWRQPPEIFR